MPYTHPVAILSIALTPEERRALKVIAAQEDVSMARIIRDLLAERYETFRAVSYQRANEV